jgi:hypothetical protein
MSESLDALALAAEEIDRDAAAGEPGAMIEAARADESAAVAVDNAEQIRMILDLALPLLGSMYPSLNDVYTEAARGAVAASLARVLTKYGININDWGGRYKEEIGALMVCGPIAWATVQAVKSDIAAREKQPPKELPKPDAQYEAVRVPEAVHLG